MASRKPTSNHHHYDRFFFNRHRNDDYECQGGGMYSLTLKYKAITARRPVFPPTNALVAADLRLLSGR